MGVETTNEEVVEVNSPRVTTFEKVSLTDAERNAIEGNDPDIAEILVVKRPKSRMPLDLEWAQSDQAATNAETAPDDVHEDSDATNGEVQKSKNGWWNKGKGKKVEIVVEGTCLSTYFHDVSLTALSRLSFMRIQEQQSAAPSNSVAAALS
jgi:hypothetical protein